MSLFLRQAGADVPFAERVAYNSQIAQLGRDRAMGLQTAAEVAVAVNAGRTPGDLFRYFDTKVKLEPKANGEHGLLSRVMSASKSISYGNVSYEYSNAARVGTAKGSLYGDHATVFDGPAFDYAGTVVPLMDIGFGLPAREYAAAQADGFDILNSSSIGAERTLMDLADSYLYDGNPLWKKGNAVWLGLRNDPSVAQATLAVNLTASGTTSAQIFAEFKRLAEILLNDEDCGGALSVPVSREIMSRLQDPWDIGTGSNNTMFVLDMIKKIRGIAEIFEDKRLVGNQLAMIYIDKEEGFHPVTGMALSSFAEPRLRNRDPYNFVKQLATGFVSRQSYSGKRCALYAANA